MFVHLLIYSLSLLVFYNVTKYELAQKIERKRMSGVMIIYGIIAVYISFIHMSSVAWFLLLFEDLNVGISKRAAGYITVSVLLVAPIIITYFLLRKLRRYAFGKEEDYGVIFAITKARRSSDVFVINDKKLSLEPYDAGGWVYTDSKTGKRYIISNDTRHLVEQELLQIETTGNPVGVFADLSARFGILFVISSIKLLTLLLIIASPFAWLFMERFNYASDTFIKHGTLIDKQETPAR